MATPHFKTKTSLLVVLKEFSFLKLKQFRRRKSLHLSHLETKRGIVQMTSPSVNPFPVRLLSSSSADYRAGVESARGVHPPKVTCLLLLLLLLLSLKIQSDYGEWRPKSFQGIIRFSSTGPISLSSASTERERIGERERKGAHKLRS